MVLVSSEPGSKYRVQVFLPRGVKTLQCNNPVIWSANLFWTLLTIFYFSAPVNELHIDLVC